MIWTLIEVGGIIFWLLLAALIVFEFVCYEFERKISGVVGLIAFVGLIWLFGNFDLFGFLGANWSVILLTLVAYFVAGIVWGFGKWEFWLSKRRREFEAKKQDWLEKQNWSGNEVPVQLRDSWTREVVKTYATGMGYISSVDLSEWPSDRVKGLVVPKASKNKGLIIYWMSYWPISLLWTLLRDVLKEIWEFLYFRICKYLQRRSEANFKGVESEFSSSAPADEDSSDKN